MRKGWWVPLTGAAILFAILAAAPAGPIGFFGAGAVGRRHQRDVHEATTVDGGVETGVAGKSAAAGTSRRCSSKGAPWPR